MNPGVLEVGLLEMITSRYMLGDLDGWRWVPFLPFSPVIDDCNLKEIED
jgi:hypothetical protein